MLDALKTSTIKYRCPICSSTTWRSAGFLARLLTRLGIVPCEPCVVLKRGWRT